MSFNINQHKKSVHPVGSINGFLGNSARTDVIGREMYNDGDSRAENPAVSVPGTGSHDYQVPESWEGAQVRGQIPHLNWGMARLGLPGNWCFGNQTELSDVLTIEIGYKKEDSYQKLELIPTRNWWTPAVIETYYRSKPIKGSGEYPFSGYLTVKEKKCITPDNVFVSEITLIHDNKVPGEYSISINTPHFKKEKASGLRVVDTQTKVGGIGEQIKLNGYAAVLVSEDGSDSFNISLHPFEILTFKYSFCVNLQSYEKAHEKALIPLENHNVFDDNIKAFDRWFNENVPPLRIENKDVQKVYYYRWFVVYRALHKPQTVIPNHPYPKRCFYESPMGNWFGCVIGLPVALQLQEARWLRDGSYGYEHIQNWAENIACYQGYIQYTPAAIWDYYKNHPDEKILSKVYEAAKAFALSKVNDQDDPELPVQEGSWGTGAEYQPNFYQFTKPAWDYRHDTEGKKKYGFELAKLNRLDTVCFAIANLMACSKMAVYLNKPEDSKSLFSIAEKLKALVIEKMWDKDTQMFYSVDPTTGQKADKAACYDSYIPFVFGIADKKEYLPAFDKFFDPKWFWDEFPISTASKTCDMYWSGNCLTGPVDASVSNPHQYECSWNGPAWHFSNSLMASALGEAALFENSKSLRSGWLEFMRRWTEMHFLFGDKTVPISNEHVRPSDGARFRRINDYFHSAWLDPLIRYYFGISMYEDKASLTFDPFTDEEFELYNLPIMGRELSFIQQIKDDVITRLIINEQGEIIATSEMGEAITVDF